MTLALRGALTQALDDATGTQGVAPITEAEREALSWRAYALRDLQFMSRMLQSPSPVPLKRKRTTISRSHASCTTHPSQQKPRSDGPGAVTGKKCEFSTSLPPISPPIAMAGRFIPCMLCAEGSLGQGMMYTCVRPVSMVPTIATCRMIVPSTLTEFRFTIVDQVRSGGFIGRLILTFDVGRWCAGSMPCTFIQCFFSNLGRRPSVGQGRGALCAVTSRDACWRSDQAAQRRHQARLDLTH